MNVPDWVYKLPWMETYGFDDGPYIILSDGVDWASKGISKTWPKKGRVICYTTRPDAFDGESLLAAKWNGERWVYLPKKIRDAYLLSAMPLIPSGDYL